MTRIPVYCVSSSSRWVESFFCRDWGIIGGPERANCFHFGCEGAWNDGVTVAKRFSGRVAEMIHSSIERSIVQPAIHLAFAALRAVSQN